MRRSRAFGRKASAVSLAHGIGLPARLLVRGEECAHRAPSVEAGDHPRTFREARSAHPRTYTQQRRLIR